MLSQQLVFAIARKQLSATAFCRYLQQHTTAAAAAAAIAASRSHCCCKCSSFSTNALNVTNNNNNNSNITSYPCCPEDFIDLMAQSSHHRNTMAYALAFDSSSEENDMNSSTMQSLLTERMKRQLQVAENQLVMSKKEKKGSNKQDYMQQQQQQQQQQHPEHQFAMDMPQLVNVEIPTTLDEAVAIQDDRAVVVTELRHPHRISHVNDAWIQLCGYTREESIGRTLKMLQGPDTNASRIDHSVEMMLHYGSVVAGPTVVTNYTKTGRKFQNALKMGPLYNRDGRMTHLVGILTEVVANTAKEHQLQQEEQQKGEQVAFGI